MTKKFYLTIAIPYVNGSPHAGHALEFIQGDTVARYHKLLGEDVFFISGSDENGLKIVQAAQKENLMPQELADRNTQRFQEFAKALNVNFDVWRRGSDQKLHWPGSQKLWHLCLQNDDIYKKLYGGFYCVGCEDFYIEKNLIDGKCPEHLTKLEWVEEENYFFRLSRYQKQIEELINSNKLLIIPQTRRNEILTFIKSGLQDFSVSRSKQRAKNWGIPVPNDESQVIYTWFDALNIYQTAVGFGYDEKFWQKWWPADLHIIGKGIIRFHAVYWIGMLLSAGLPLPKSLFVHGYISSGGHKMSKSLGNVVDPFEIVKKYGTDSVRYYFLREIPSYGDGDFSENRFKKLYNADLANGLGNLAARVAKLAEKTKLQDLASQGDTLRSYSFNDNYGLALNEFRFNDALAFVWEKVTAANKIIDEAQPWKLEKKELQEFLPKVILQILEIGYLLEPFLPETSQKIKQRFQNKIKIKSSLFPRIV